MLGFLENDLIKTNYDLVDIENNLRFWIAKL